MSPIPLKRQSLMMGTVAGSQLAAALTLFKQKHSPLATARIARKTLQFFAPSRLFVATSGDPAAVGDVGMGNPGNPRQFSIGEVWLRGD